MSLTDCQKSVLQERIKRHEGLRLTPYKDSRGVWTACYGRNLESVPFTINEAELMFQTDFRRAYQGAENFSCYEILTPARKGVLIEMVFQLGPGTVSQFRKFKAACDDGDWNTAADEMLDSRWHEQTPGRVEELAEIFRRG